MSVVDIALMLLGLAFLASLFRVGFGPSLADRALAIDVALFTVVAGIALLAIEFEAYAFDDVVLIATLLGFVATSALAWLLGRGR